MQEISFANEQEAAVAILFASVLNGSHQLTQSEIEQLSRMLVLSSRFRGTELNELTIKALSMHAQYGSRTIIEHAASLVTEEFRDTLFAMCCELVTADGKLDEEESEILGMVALYLGLTMENMKMILTTYLVRNRWNVQIVEA
ncbi:MAG TPA: TerB family tellurite resistance protein [Flavisolibacter sp.]